MFSFIKGFLDCFSGFGLLLKPGVKRYVIIPLVVNIGLFTLAGKLLSDQIDIWMEKLLPAWLDWLEWLIYPLFYIALAIIVFYSFTIVANLIAAPFNSLLSARVEANLTGKKPKDINADGFIRLTVRTLRSELQKILYAIKWSIPLLIITVIPGVNVAAPFLWILFAAWFFALEYHDYPLGNRGQLFDDIIAFNRSNRMRAYGLGTAVFLLTSIPLLNFLAMPVSVAGATRSMTKLGESSKP
jgi:CysZ protein